MINVGTFFRWYLRQYFLQILEMNLLQYIIYLSAME